MLGFRCVAVEVDDVGFGVLDGQLLAYARKYFIASDRMRLGV